MACGQQLIEDVAAVLNDIPATQHAIRAKLTRTASPRAVRYAIAALVKEGRAKRRGHRGYYVINEQTAVLSKDAGKDSSASF